MSKLYPEAIELYTKAIELKKDEPTFYINRKTTILPTLGATARLQLEQFDEVIQDCDKAIELNP